MKIDEAILVIENEVRVAELNDRPLEVKAFRLGIEALNQIKESRFDPSTWEPRLLPGETES